MSSRYDRLYEVRWDADTRALVYLGLDGSWRPVPGLGGDVAITDEDGNPVTVRQVENERALVSTDERTHRILDEIRVLLVALLTTARDGDDNDGTVEDP